MRVLIENGRVIDPSQNIDRTMNLLIEDGRIVAHDAPSSDALGGADNLTVLDASGRIVSPGLIDMHVHLREPGSEEDETIETGTAAALAGGFTSVVCMPNTDPPIDTQGAVEFVKGQAARADHCNVFVVACVSKNREGKELAEIGQLHAAGAVGFSDDGSPITNSELMRRAFEYCLMFDTPVLNHCEIKELVIGGVMHEGMTSMLLGLGGMPAEAEAAMISRDIALAAATGGRYHVMHVSTADGVDAIRRAKTRGTRVTCEICPHHFSLTDRSLRTFDANFKMNPPLRDESDVQACIAGLIDGTIDVIASDHAPHAREKKMQELDRAPFGVIGLETALGLVATKLIQPGHLTWMDALAKMTCNPARILHLEKGTLQIGAAADITIIDPTVGWKVDVNDMYSKSTNTPFAGEDLVGRAETVLVDGRVKFSRR